MSGSVHPYEVADLYANVSGYLKSEKSVVEREDRSWSISASTSRRGCPGDHRRARDRRPRGPGRRRCRAGRGAGQAGRGGGRDGPGQLRTPPRPASPRPRPTSAATRPPENETYKAYNRYKRLSGLSAVEADVVDQKEDAYESAIAAEKAARAAIITANAKVAAAKAKIEQAVADRKAAEANVAVAKSKLKKAEVFVAYTKIHLAVHGRGHASRLLPGRFHPLGHRGEHPADVHGRAQRPDAHRDQDLRSRRPLCRRGRPGQRHHRRPPGLRARPDGSRGSRRPRSPTNGR